MSFPFHITIGIVFYIFNEILNKNILSLKYRNKEKFSVHIHLCNITNKGTSKYSKLELYSIQNNQTKRFTKIENPNVMNSKVSLQIMKKNIIAFNYFSVVIFLNYFVFSITILPLTLCLYFVFNSNKYIA